MKRWIAVASVLALALFTSTFAVNSSPSSAVAEPAHWPQWRGPSFNGMARTGAPTEFSDTKNIKWKIALPGRGFSTPVFWGDKIFLTNAVPTGKAAAPPATADNQAAPGASGGGR